jgi:hypothetical protein
MTPQAQLTQELSQSTQLIASVRSELAAFDELIPLQAEAAEKRERLLRTA